MKIVVVFKVHMFKVVSIIRFPTLRFRFAYRSELIGNTSFLQMKRKNQNHNEKIVIAVDVDEGFNFY
jgi:hypothetical protein